MRNRNLGWTMLAVLLAMPAAAAERIAVFDPELYDTSGEGIREDQQLRLALIGTQLRTALRASGRYELVDPAPQRARLAKGPPLRTCPSCAPDAAAAVGADLALLTTVNKVSNLILSVTLVVREASPATGTRGVYSAEIRGNTDESWTHGVRWLLRNRLLAPPP